MPEETVPAADELRLHVPRAEDGWFYVKMMSDPATMAYNAPWFPPDGCIPGAEEEWQDIVSDWVGQESVRFYALLQRAADGAFVGDVNYHYDPERGRYDMGVVIYAPERGRGYAKQGLKLLLHRAFAVNSVPRLDNEFETSRGAAYRAHKAVGFRDIGTDNGMYRLALTREQYLSDLAEGKV